MTAMDERSTRLIRQAWPRQALFMLVLAALLFARGRHGSLLAGRGCSSSRSLARAPRSALYFVKHDPALIERRMPGGPQPRQEPAQKIIIALLMAGLLLLILVPGARPPLALVGRSAPGSRFWPMPASS